MKILCILNYYYPYISGVSEYARVICEKLVKAGNDVLVLTSNHAKLPKKEVINNVKVMRTSVICKISKGTVSPEFIIQAVKLSHDADVVWLHLPMIESGIIASMVAKKKLVCTYHCDINLPKSILNDFIVKVMDISNNQCLKRSQGILVTSVDYAKHSRLGQKHISKLIEAGAPIKEYQCKDKVRSDKKVIGFCGRIVEEKGIDVLINAFALLSKKRNDIVLKIGGDYKNIAGGSIYEILQKQIQSLGVQNIEFLGRIPDEKMGEFYSELDVFVLPSINSLEAFGMVQLEAMFCGVPVVASDLYGVRTIVTNTSMGVVVEKNNAKALADGINEVIDNPKKYIRSKSDIKMKYGTEKCYEIIERTLKKVTRE